MKITRQVALRAARELIEGETATARAIVAAGKPGDGPATWAGVFSKILEMNQSLQARTPLTQAAFRVFARGNSKLPFWSFSSMAVLDCPGRGECEGWCYSLKSWRNPNALGRQLSNSLLMRHASGRAFIAREFSRLKTDTVRLFVDGDFHSKANLRWWMELIRKRPSVSVYGYSKSWVEFMALQLEGFAWPGNYLLNLSGGSRHSEMLREAMQGLPCVRGEFIAVPVPRQHMKSHAYQSRRNPGFKDYARDVRAASPGRVFVCSGTCGDCLTVAGKNKHACGHEGMRGVSIAIGVH